MWDVTQSYSDMRNALIHESQVKPGCEDALEIDAAPLVVDVSTVIPAIS